MFVLLDAMIVCAALASAWYWYVTSDRRLRRITEHEVLNDSDLNRVIAAINEVQILSARPAMATAVASVLTALRFALHVAART
jgi:hypothetical protein